MSLITVFILKPILSNMNIAVPELLWFPFAWNIIFHPLTFSRHVGLFWGAYIQSYFCIHSASLYLLLGALNLLIFKIVIDMYLPTAISWWVGFKFVVLFSYISLLLSSLVVWWPSLVLCLCSCFFFVFLSVVVSCLFACISHFPCLEHFL